METHIVIMAGGVGSRFWPMSTPDYPKQFIDIMGCGKSLIQLTAERFSSLCDSKNIWVVTSEKYKEIVKEQLPSLPKNNILTEPESRNTAPCIAYACWKIKHDHPKANIVVTPSDALVIDTTEFQRVIKEALSFTATHDSIVTIGIKPNRPETGYGYIHAEESKKKAEIRQVKAFKEKPDIKTAEEYVTHGNYYWNAGIFVWNIDTITEALQKFTPRLAAIMDELAKDFNTPWEMHSLKKLFPTCEKISIDYAVMEKAESIYTLPAEFGWSDLGSWGSLQTLLPHDATGNASVGTNIKLYNCRNCIVHTAEEKKVVVEGLENYIIAEKNGALLICSLKEEQRIKEFAQ